MRLMGSALFILSLVGVPTSAAPVAGSQSFTLDGQLFLTGSTTPLTDANATIVVQVLDPDAKCILYEEKHTSVDTTVNGYFSIKVGTPVGAGTRGLNDSGNSMTKVFSNAGSMPAVDAPSQTCVGSAYAPIAGHGRLFRLIVTPSAGGGSDTLAPDIPVDQVPNAMVAETLQGVPASGFINANTLAPAMLSQANVENVFSTSNYPRLTDLLNGNSPQYVQTANNGTIEIPLASGTPTGLVDGNMWYDISNHQLKYYDGSTTVVVGGGGGGSGSVTSVSSGTGLLGGPITNTGTLAVDVGTSDGQVVQVQSGGKLPALDGSGLTNLNGSAIQTGTIGGAAAVSTSGNIQTSGAMTANRVALYDHSGVGPGFVNLAVPTDMAGSGGAAYTLTFPDRVGSTGQVLSNGGGGALAWFTLPTALPPNGAAGGALTGTYPNPGLADSTVTTPKIFANPGINRIVATDGSTGSTLSPLSCLTPGHLLTWHNSNGWVCTDPSTLSTSTPANFSGTLVGDVTGTQGATVVSTVGLSTAADLHNAEVLANAATPTNTANMIVKRGPTGNFDASLITLNLGLNLRDSGANSVQLRAPAAVVSPYTLRFPTSAGANHQVMETDAAGNLSWVTVPSAPASNCTAGQVLTYTGGAYACVTDQTTGGGAGITSLNGETGATQTFGTPTNTGTASLWSSSGNVHTLNIPMAGTPGTGAGLLSNAEYSQFNNKLGVTTIFSGDVGGTYNSTSVNKIKGTTVTITSLTTGQYLRYNGTAFVNTAISQSDVTNLTADLANKIDVTQMPGNCSSGQTLTFSAPLGSWACANIGIAGSQITSGTVPAAAMPALTGDVTSSAGSVATSLSNTGVSAGTYTRVTVDAKGRVTAGSVADASDFASQAAKTFLAAPNGAGGTPSFRAMLASDLPSTAVTPATYGDASRSVSVTIDQQGRITSASQPSIAIAGSQVTSGTLPVGRLPAFTGDVTSSAGTDALSIGTGKVTSAHILDGTIAPADLTTGIQNGLWSGNGTDAYRLGGNIGIGVSSPSNRLVVGDDSSGASGSPSSSIAIGNSSGNSVLMVGQSAGARGRVAWIYDATPANAYMVVGTSGANLVLQHNGGNVGIGTNAPAQKLEVAGKIKSTNLREFASDATARSTTSTSYADIPGLSLTVNGSGLPVMISAVVPLWHDTALGHGYVQIVVDGTPQSVQALQFNGSSDVKTMHLQWMQILPAGSHTIKLQWMTNTGTLNSNWTNSMSSLLISE